MMDNEQLQQLIDTYKGEKTFYDGELLGVFFTIANLEAFAKAYTEQAIAKAKENE
jgi:hypothetical protein